jgi:gliding motility-associated-like protein
MKLPMIILFVCLLSLIGKTQPCNSVINSFPYNEGFEMNEGGWAPFGTSSDWIWAAPQKIIIGTAGEGNKCWTTGGTRTTGYTNGENAWLLSPCFNFGTLVNPEISFKIIWETEQRFDGANLQYTLDNGSNWTVLGDIQTGITCTAVNWYNTPSVTYAGNAKGWSGSIYPTAGSCLGGNGSGGWLDARHSLNNLAGQSSVRFRFLFGAGTTCNNYDGFGIDDIRIAEAAPPNTPLQIETTCIDSVSLKFRPVGECIQTCQWDFGEPLSGSQNTSTLLSPEHSYSSPGIYTVTLLVTNAAGIVSATTKEVTIIGAQKLVNWPGACTNISDATLMVIPSGSNQPYIYSWDTNPPQTTAFITNAGAGTYSVFINSPGACSLKEQFILTSSIAMDVNTTIRNASCGSLNGSLAATVTGGAGPYNYLWSNGATTSSIGSLSSGTYSLTVTDANNCSKAVGPYTIINDNRNLLVNIGNDRNICPGQIITLSPGTFTAYKWQDGSTAPTFLATTGGIYFVEVTDALGCTGSDTIHINADCSDVYFPSAFTPNNDGKNDAFGPLGNLTGLSGYYLGIFDRYGNRIFYSNNPFAKWDGTYKGMKLNTAAFVWISEFILNGRKQLRKGSAAIIR